MKKPEEIKKGMECCLFGQCGSCPYSEEYGCDCSEHLRDDIREYHNQLEAERDAALADIEESQPCFACRNFNRNSGKCGGGKRCLRLAEIAERNGGTYQGKFFEWRGVQKEKTK